MLATPEVAAAIPTQAPDCFRKRRRALERGAAPSSVCTPSLERGPAPPLTCALSLERGAVSASTMVIPLYRSTDRMIPSLGLSPWQELSDGHGRRSICGDARAGRSEACVWHRGRQPQRDYRQPAPAAQDRMDSRQAGGGGCFRRGRGGPSHGEPRRL